MSILIDKEKRMNHLIETAFRHFRKKGFPYIEMTPQELWEEFFDLQDKDLRITTSENGLLDLKIIDELEVSAIGIRIANFFHRHIWDSHAINMDSPMQAFNKDKKLKRAIMLSYKFKMPVLNVLRFVSGTQVCSNFRPTAAKAIYERYYKKGNVLDPSTGYGGRLIGFLGSNLPETCQYVGVDPSIKTFKQNTRMAMFFKMKHLVDLTCAPFEDVDIDFLKSKKIGFAFTSPPYFKKEIYQEKEDNCDQSCHRYDEYESWKENFWTTVLNNVLECMADNGTFVINIQDIKIGKNNYPLVDETKDLAKKVGWKFDDILYMKFPQIGKGLEKTKFESVLVFKKGS